MANHPITFSQWQEKADTLSFNGHAFVCDEYTTAKSGETYECRSPIDGRLLTTVASCQQEDAEQAVAIARQVFEKESGRAGPLVSASRFCCGLRI